MNPTINNITGYNQDMQTIYNEITNMSEESTYQMIGKLVATEKFIPGSQYINYDINEYSAKIAYQGFKPFVIASIVFKVAKNTDLSYIGKLIQIGMERGNNLTKMKKGASSFFLNELRTLTSMFSLKEKVGKNPHTITLSRIVMSFPQVSCSFTSINKHPTVPYSLLNSLSPGYPRQMMVSAFGAIIPNMNDDYCLELLNAFYIHQYEFSSAITPDKTKIRPPKDELTDLIRYTRAAVEGSYLNFDVKIQLLEEYELIHKDGETYGVSREVEQASDVWQEIYIKRK